MAAALGNKPSVHSHPMLIMRLTGVQRVCHKPGRDSSGGGAGNADAPEPATGAPRLARKGAGTVRTRSGSTASCCVTMHHEALAHGLILVVTHFIACAMLTASCSKDFWQLPRHHVVPSLNRCPRNSRRACLHCVQVQAVTESRLYKSYGRLSGRRRQGLEVSGRRLLQSGTDAPETVVKPIQNGNRTIVPA